MSPQPPANAVKVFSRNGVVTGWLAGRRLTDAEIYRLARTRWLPWRAMMMTAIALAESVGYCGATGDVDKVDVKWSTSDGLWQIRHTTGDRRDLYDPQVNAGAAAERLASQGFGAWGAYRRGAFVKFLPRANRARRDARE